MRLGIWAVTAGILLFCIVFVRLFFAPINLDFARDLIVDRTGEYLPGWQVSYRSAEIGWDWSAVQPWVVLEDITLIDRRNRLDATIAEARVVVSLTNVFSGATLSAIDVKNAHINITDLGGFSDDTDDSMFDDLFADGVPTPEAFKPLTEAFSRFSMRLLSNAPTLEGITFTNFSVDIARGADLSVFSIAAPNFRLDHYRDQLQLASQMDISLAGMPTRVRLAGTAEPSKGMLSLTLGFSDLSPAAFAPAFQSPDIMGFMDFPVGLDLFLDMTAASGLRSAAFEISIGEGELRHPVQFPDGSPIDYGIISAAYDVQKDMVTVKSIELSLGGSIVRGEGLVYWLADYQKPGIRFTLSLDETSLENVKKYWPIRLFPDGRPRGARAWIDQNMLNGTAKNIQFTAHVEPDGTTPFAVGSPYIVTFDVEDVDTYYLKTMAPILGASGRAVLTLTEFDMTIDSGTVASMPIKGSKAHLYNINKRGKGVGEFAFKLKGDVADILTLVEPKPVRIKDRLKIDLARLGGTADVSLDLKLPLVRRPPKEQVIYKVAANITDGRLDNLLGGEGLRGASIALKLDVDTMRASGQGAINGTQMDFSWQEDFKAGRLDPAADTTQLVMSGRTNQQDLLNLKVDIRDYLEGDMLSEAIFLGRNFKFRVGYFSGDASEARLNVPQLGWSKDPGVPANINGTVHLGAQQFRIAPLTVKGEGIDLSATIAWPVGGGGSGGGGGGGLDARFEVAELGRSRLSAIISSDDARKVTANITADRFDLAPLLARKSVLVKRDGGSPLAEGPKKLTRKPVKKLFNAAFDLRLDAKQMLLMNGVIFEDAQADLSFAGGEPVKMHVTAEAPGGGFMLKLEDGSPQPDGDMRPLAVQSDDAGSLMRGLGLFAHMESGNLTLEGLTNGWGEALELEGVLKISDTQMIATNKLDANVTEGVIRGVDNYLEGGSVPLDVVNFPFVYKQGLLDISKAKANGPSLGMTMEGQIETGAGRINVNGVVVPAYGLNSLLGKIPLVGGLFSGGDGKGLFGVTYRVKGLTEKPDVSVNAMSGLAPGFLRNLFEGRKGKVSDVKSAVPEAETAVEAPKDTLKDIAKPKPKPKPKSKPELESQPEAKPKPEPANNPA